MSKTESKDYKAMISDEGGVVRGRIPAPLVRVMGARAGDHMIFHYDGTGRVTLSVKRGRAAGKKGATAKAKTAKRGKRG